MLRILALLISFTFFSPAFAETLTMTVSNKTSSKIIVKFHSEDRKGHMWPSTTTHWPVNAGQTTNLKISCKQNEYICYGAKEDGGSRTWGVGYSRNTKCTTCCYRCNNTTFSKNLTY